MDKDMALDLARQLREHVHYAGDAEAFDKEVLELIKVVEEQCALVVEKTPPQLFLISKNPLKLITEAVRGNL